MLKHKDERPQRDPGACVSWAQARWQRFTHTGLCKSGRRRPRAGSQPCRAMEAETRGALPASSPCRAAETRGPRGSRKQEQSSVLQKCISHCRARFSVCTLEQVKDGQWTSPKSWGILAQSRSSIYTSQTGKGIIWWQSVSTSKPNKERQNKVHHGKTLIKRITILQAAVQQIPISNKTLSLFLKAQWSTGR